MNNDLLNTIKLKIEQQVSH